MENMNSPSIHPILGKTDFPFSFTRIHRFTVTEKDVSLSLEMTRGRGSPRIVFHTAPYVCNFRQTRSPLLRGTCTSSRHSILRLWRGPSPRAYSLGTVSHWLSYRSHPIRPCGAPSPRGEGCDTRLPSSKKAAKPPPYNKAPSTSVGMTFKGNG